MVSVFGSPSFIRGPDEPFPAKSFINEEKQLPLFSPENSNIRLSSE